LSRAALTAALVVVYALAGAGPGEGASAGRSDWPLPNLGLDSTRSLPGTGIDRQNVHSLRVAWRFRFPYPPGDSGAFTATPVVANGVVYIEDMRSNVFALDLASGRVRWRRLFGATNPGPDGLAVSGGQVYGATDSSAFALDAATGKILWRHFLATSRAPFVDIAPQVADGLVYVSTVGLPPEGDGVLYALDRTTGKIRWRFSTFPGRARVPALAGGGGAWYTPSLAGGDIFWGTTNPYPYGGTRRYPNGGAYAGRALYTDSLVVLDAATGKLAWYDQVTPHDVRDYDFQLPPVIGELSGRPVVFGAGKAGLVIAWNRATHRRLWKTAVGVHRNDSGSLPRRPVSVCPGLLGGAETPMASDGKRLYVPIVDLCMKGSSVGYEDLDRVDVAARGKGELVALDAVSGHAAWTHRFPQADFGCATVTGGVVFTSTFDGRLYGLDTRNGRTLWTASAPAGINACPSLATGTLLVGAGVKLTTGDVPELVAYRAGSGS
jgi:alcohol dehydrogenase (cytochrome c)